MYIYIHKCNYLYLFIYLCFQYPEKPICVTIKLTDLEDICINSICIALRYDRYTIGYIVCFCIYAQDFVIIIVYFCSLNI